RSAAGPTWPGEGGVERALDPQTPLLYGGQMRPTRHKRHLMPRPSQQRTEVAAHTSCPHHGNAHRSPSVVPLALMSLSPPAVSCREKGLRCAGQLGSHNFPHLLHTRQGGELVLLFLFIVDFRAIHVDVQ